jgi:hypothetical protein
MELLNNKFKRNPALKVQFDKNERTLQNFIQQRQKVKSFEKTLATPAVIPIVFHIVLPNPAIVTDAQIQAQLDTLNVDYAGLNGDSIRVPSWFKSVFGKSGISFCLAQRTPTDEPSDGIDRFASTKATFSNSDGESVKHAALGGVNAWDPTRYLNVWICDLSNNLLGYGTFPGGSSPDEQGVVVDYASLPAGPLNGYNRGKTMTHEIGHYFNLYHIWGDDDGACTGTDYVADTPNQANSTSGCPSGMQVDSCSPVAPGFMYENYMDYSGDDCLVMFTAGQVDRMEAALTLDRASLLTSNACTPVNLQNYDAQPRLINSPSSRLCDANFTPTVTIFNRGSLALTSLTITALVDNGAPVVTNWTGSISSLTSGMVTLNGMTTATGNHILTVYTTNPDGVLDQNTSNDTLNQSIMYFPPVSPPVTESFEGSVFPPQGWDIVNEDGLVTWQKINGYAKTGSNSVYINNFNDQLIGQKDYLRLATVNISNADSAFISFQVAAATFSDPSGSGNAFDTLELVVSTDCGITYTSMYKKWGASLVTRQGATATEFFPAPGEWRKDSVDISSFISRGNVMLAFRNTNEWENNIFLDDINVRTVTVNPNLKQQGFLVTPNPTSGQVAVQFYPQPDKLKGIIIFSSVGQKIAETIVTPGQSNNYYSYDLSHFAPGVYIVRALFTDKTMTKKIVLVH